MTVSSWVTHGTSLFVAVYGALLVGMLIGLINGLIVTAVVVARRLFIGGHASVIAAGVPSVFMT